MGERLFFMKTFVASTPKGVFDLESQSLSEFPIDAVELTDEDLEQVTGSWGCWGCGWGGGFGFSPFWGWGGFGFSPFWGWGGFGSSFAFSGFSGAFARSSFW
jgi:hypothetical protein